MRIGQIFRFIRTVVDNESPWERRFFVGMKRSTWFSKDNIEYILRKFIGLSFLWLSKVVKNLKSIKYIALYIIIKKNFIKPDWGHARANRYCTSYLEHLALTIDWCIGTHHLQKSVFTRLASDAIRLKLNKMPLVWYNGQNDWKNKLVGCELVREYP